MAALAAVVFVEAGCVGRTEIVIGIATNLRIPDELDEVELVVLDAAGARAVEQSWDLRTVDLPGSFGLVPSDDKRARIDVIVRGRRDGRDVVERKARLGYVEGRTLFLRMFLSRRCLTQGRPFCSEEKRTCVEGECKGFELNESGLPEYVAGQERRADCGDAEAARQAGLEPPAMASCPAGQACVDFTCVGSPPGDGGAAGDLTAGAGDMSMGSGADLPMDLAMSPMDGGADLSASMEMDLVMARPDLSIVPGMDLSMNSGMDLSVGPGADLSKPVMDLVMPPGADLSMPVDLSSPPDMAQADFTMADLSRPPDLVSFDYTMADLALPPDLIRPDFAMPDLAPPDWLQPFDMRPVVSEDILVLVGDLKAGQPNK